MKNIPKKLAVIICGVLLLIIALAGIIIGTPAASALSRAKEVRAKAELESIGQALDTYYSRYGEYPSGTSTSILEALMGKNPQGVRFLILNDQGKNGKDPWGAYYSIVPVTTGGRPQFYSKRLDRIGGQ